MANGRSQDPFDPKGLEIDAEFPPTKDAAKQKKPKRGKPPAYVQTEIEWFKRAVVVSRTARSSTALAIGQMLYRSAMLQKTLTPTMPTKAIKECGIDRQARRRALSKLADAGLIYVEPRSGKNPQITIRCAWLEAHLGERCGLN